MPPNTNVKHGAVTVSVPSHLAPPERAGKMSPEEVQRIPRPPLGIGLACDQAADAIEKAGSRFMAPPEVTAAKLREAGQRAEEIDNVILDLEVILTTLKQANLLFDADAWKLLRLVNDQLKAQGKSHPELLAIFKPLVDFLAKGPRPRKTDGEPEPK